VKREAKGSDMKKVNTLRMDFRNFCFNQKVILLTGAGFAMLGAWAVYWYGQPSVFAVPFGASALCVLLAALWKPPVFEVQRLVDYQAVTKLYIQLLDSYQYSEPKDEDSISTLLMRGQGFMRRLDAGESIHEAAFLRFEEDAQAFLSRMEARKKTA
jgi:hypothetical protein